MMWHAMYMLGMINETKIKVGQNACTIRIH